MKPSLIVIFGITGDLAQRKLLPALAALRQHGQLHQDSVILGVSRRAVKVEEVTARPDVAYKDWLQSAIRMQQMDLDDAAGYQTLQESIDGIDISAEDRLYYLSVPPESYQMISGYLGQTVSAGSKLLIEKPFGSDLTSAQALLDSIARKFPERQVYRVDHYVAKPQLSRFLDFRQSQPSWDSQTISRIRITAYEALSIEGRAVFYDSVGAMRDLIQSHLLQVLAITMMPLSGQSSDQLHAARLSTLQKLRQANSASAVRGQYDGYRSEVGDQASHTETYAALQIVSDDPAWQGTNLELRTGKAMDRKVTEVHIDFHDGSQLVANLAGDGAISSTNEQFSLANFDKQQPPLQDAPDG